MSQEDSANSQEAETDKDNDGDAKEAASMNHCCYKQEQSH